MAIISNRKFILDLTGDVVEQLVFNSTQGPISPGNQDLVTLATGANTILLPSGGGIVVRGVVIVPPVTNTNQILLKGVAGDTGIPISKTDPTALSFDATSPPVSFVLNNNGAGIQVRLYWN